MYLVEENIYDIVEKHIRFGNSTSEILVDISNEIHNCIWNKISEIIEAEIIDSFYSIVHSLEKEMVE